MVRDSSRRSEWRGRKSARELKKTVRFSPWPSRIGPDVSEDGIRVQLVLAEVAKIFGGDRAGE